MFFIILHVIWYMNHRNAYRLTFFCFYENYQFSLKIITGKFLIIIPSVINRPSLVSIPHAFQEQYPDTPVYALGLRLFSDVFSAVFRIGNGDPDTGEWKLTKCYK